MVCPSLLLLYLHMGTAYVISEDLGSFVTGVFHKVSNLQFIKQMYNIMSYVLNLVTITTFYGL